MEKFDNNAEHVSNSIHKHQVNPGMRISMPSHHGQVADDITATLPRENSIVCLQYVTTASTAHRGIVQRNRLATNAADHSAKRALHWWYSHMKDPREVLLASLLYSVGGPSCRSRLRNQARPHSTMVMAMQRCI
jgi:hypothetical protein